MRIRPPRDDTIAVLHQLIRECRRILYDLCAVLLERGLQCLAECHGLCRDDVHQGTSLNAGEHRLVDLRAELLIASKDEAAARTAQGLVRGRRHDIGVRDRARMLPCGNKSCDVRHIHQKDCTDRLCDCSDAFKVNRTCIRGSPCNDHLRLLLVRKPFECIVVDALRFLVHTVGDDLIVRAGDVDGTAVRQMSAVRQIHAENRITRLQEGKEHRHIRLCARMRLHICPVGSKEFLRTVDRQLLRHVDVFTAAVVTLAGVALRIFIRENTPLRLHNRVADDVLRRDELQFRALAIEFILNRLVHLCICLAQRIHNAHKNSPSSIFLSCSAMVFSTRRA